MRSLLYQDYLCALVTGNTEIIYEQTTTPRVLRKNFQILKQDVKKCLCDKCTVDFLISTALE
jgi:hypothetical protein